MNLSGEPNTTQWRQPVSEQPSARPLFICGMARSGTTLLIRLLDDHSKLAVLPGETYFYQSVLDSKFWGAVYRIAEYSMSNAVMDNLARLFWQSMISISDTSLREKLRKLSYSFAAMNSALLDKNVRAVTGSHVDASSYWDCILHVYDLHSACPHSEKQWWVEKTPSNERFVPLINSQFNGVEKYLHIVRDPRDVVASWLLRASPDVDRNRLILRVCHIWSMSVYAANVYLSRYPDRYHVLRYEELVEDPETTMRGIADVLGIAMEPGLFSPTRLGEPKEINSVHMPESSVMSITTDHIGRYRDVLTRTETRDIEALVGNQMENYAYAVQHADSSARTVRNVAGSGNSRQRVKDRLRRRHILAMQRSEITLQPFA